ncbi:TRF2-interacting telomeric protein/Rap1 C terminal domain-containing protein [Trichoderma chlorosporum]
MASHITYDGVVGAAAGGNIFRGIKFWVSRRVPQRDSILDKIQSNSGVVVVLEKDADILIADHARKDAPHGSFSWKFITESVNAGVIQVEDKYLIGPPPNQRKSVLTGAHSKRTRTPFSEADDAIVAKWILEHGINTAGNKMYMDLEDKYPHHPWQSWRNRWVKCLSLKSNAEIDRLARLANVDVDNAPITAKHIIRRHKREDWPHAPQNNAAPTTRDENSHNHKIPSPRVSRNEQSQPREAAPSDRGRRRTADDAAVESNSEGDEEEDATIYYEVANGDKPAAINDAEPEKKERQAKHENRQKEDTRAELGGKQDEEERENDEQDTENDSTQDEASVDGGLPSFSEKEQFLNDLQDYCEATGKDFDTRCVIGHDDVDLWELFCAVSAQDLPPDELDWEQVAQQVGLGWAESSESTEVTTALLKSSYNRHLADFIAAMVSFEENEEDPNEDLAEAEESAIRGEEIAAESITPRASQRSGEASPSLSHNNSPASKKRLPDRQLLTPTKLVKRRRTVHVEIPVTPEHKRMTGGRLSAPASAPGNLQSMAHQEQELPELGTPRQRTPRRNQQRQQSPDEPDLTPSEQLRSESDTAVSPEPIEPGTPTLYFSPAAASSFPLRNGRQLETIQEEESASSTPTKSRSKKRELPSSFQEPREPRHIQLEERREKRRQLEEERRQRQQQRQQQRLEEHRRAVRQEERRQRKQQQQEQELQRQQRLEEHRQQELRQEERRREEQQQKEEQQREQEQGQEQELQQQQQRWHQDAADSDEADPEVIQQSQEQFVSWKEHYLNQGFSEDVILEAMRRTTMTPGEAMEAVLTSLRDGKGIPPNTEGIWTDRDDAQLKYVVRVGDLRRLPDDGGDLRRRKEKAQKMLNRLLFKHDEPRVRLRRKFHRALALAERERRQMAR